MKVAVLQMCSKRDAEANVATLATAVEACVAAGVQALFLPEIANFAETGRERVLTRATQAENDPFLQSAETLAKTTGIFVHVGSAIVLDEAQRNLGSEDGLENGSEQDRAWNRSFLYGPDGLLASYDKIHLYDADPEGIAPLRESATFSAGTNACVTELGPFRLGMSICYDVRFPHLFRALSQAGANLLVIPAAFTVPTGKAHWHVLVRARAIENGAFVIAAAQSGKHEDGRETFGHSLVVDPWGRVLLDAGVAAGAESGLHVVDLDLAQVARARDMIQSLQHDRAFSGPDRVFQNQLARS